MKTTDHKYDDIINLPHHVSPVHPPMTRADRAAQFSPFAALTGYEAVIREEGRVTDEMTELDEDAKAILNEKLKLLQNHILDGSLLEVSITFFQPDEKKTGGAYITADGLVKKIDLYDRVVIMEDGQRIPIDAIEEINL